jgi:hypothetical protein
MRVIHFAEPRPSLSGETAIAVGWSLWLPERLRECRACPLGRGGNSQEKVEA